jgi:hypothetical protein
MCAGPYYFTRTGFLPPLGVDEYAIWLGVPVDMVLDWILRFAVSDRASE